MFRYGCGTSQLLACPPLAAEVGTSRSKELADVETYTSDEQSRSSKAFRMELMGCARLGDVVLWRGAKRLEIFLEL